jgi:hypothetical protein
VAYNNPGIPVFATTGFMTLGNGATNWFQQDTTWQGTDSFTYTHGTHTIIAGAELRKMITSRSAVNQAQGQPVYRQCGRRPDAGLSDKRHDARPADQE